MRRATGCITSCAGCWGNFYPRPPRGGRPDTTDKSKQRMEFLSTPSARRATAAYLLRLAESRYFYPRPPRGGRPPAGVLARWSIRFLSTPSARRATPVIPGSPPGLSISIHALREEGDAAIAARRPLSNDFYPRPPRGGRRGGRRGNPLPESISIHALREEGDSACPKSSRSVKMISIHALREEGDPSQSTLMASSANFYPRPPRGGRPSVSHSRKAC